MANIRAAADDIQLMQQAILDAPESMTKKVDRALLQLLLSEYAAGFAPFQPGSSYRIEKCMMYPGDKTGGCKVVANKAIQQGAKDFGLVHRFINIFTQKK